MPSNVAFSLLSNLKYNFPLDLKALRYAIFNKINSALEKKDTLHIG